jgi:hypothetical protein
MGRLVAIQPFVFYYLYTYYLCIATFMNTSKVYAHGSYTHIKKEDLTARIVKKKKIDHRNKLIFLASVIFKSNKVQPTTSSTTLKKKLIVVVLEFFP